MGGSGGGYNNMGSSAMSNLANPNYTAFWTWQAVHTTVARMAQTWWWEAEGWPPEVLMWKFLFWTEHNLPKSIFLVPSHFLVLFECYVWHHRFSWKVLGNDFKIWIVGHSTAFYTGRGPLLARATQGTANLNARIVKIVSFPLVMYIFILLLPHVTFTSHNSVNSRSYVLSLLIGPCSHLCLLVFEFGHCSYSAAICCESIFVCGHVVISH